MVRHALSRWPASLERVLSRLPDARPVGGSQTAWMARCPAHDDRRPSLSVSVGEGRRVLVHCHGGCPPEAVVEALGLTMADLMDPASEVRPAVRSRSQGAGLFTARQKAHARPSGVEAPGSGPAASASKVYATPDEAIAALEVQLGSHSVFYAYTDAAGVLCGLIVRWDRAEGKEIRPVSRRADGWVVGGMASPRPLYRLDDLAAQPDATVYVVEGEKAADAGRTLGVLTTTSAHGGAAPRQSDWSPLAGREVVILPDNDEAGRKYAQCVAGVLAELSPPARTRVLHLPDLGPKGDFFDWVEAHDALDSDALRERLDALAEEASVVTCEAPSKPACLACDRRGDCEAVLECLADIEPVTVRWLWAGRVALGRITVLVGRPGEGKSFLTTDIAARVTTGRPWPDGSAPADGSAILICAEDDPGDTIRPRLDAHGADVRRVHLLKMVRRTGADGQASEALFTLEDLPALASALQRHPDCRLVVVDPIGSFLGGRADAHRDNDVRRVLAPVAILAEAHGAAVLVVAHRRKSPGAHADDLTLGSRAFTGIARAVWHLSRDPQDKTRRLLLPGKNNLAVEGQGLAFTITGMPPAIVWEPEPVRLTADEALAEAQDGDAAARNEAGQWLCDVLADGPVRSTELFEHAEAEGITRSTLRRAKSALAIRSQRQGAGSDVGWYWSLPD